MSEAGAGAESDSDADEVARGAARSRTARTWRRVGLVGFTLVVAAAVTGVLGPATTTRSLESTVGDVSVTYPRVVRSGGEVEIAISVSEGTTDQVVVHLDQDSVRDMGLDLYSPTPESSSVHGGRISLTFATPTGSSYLTLSGRMPVQAHPGLHELRLTVNDDERTDSPKTWNVVILP